MDRSGEVRRALSAAFTLGLAIFTLAVMLALFVPLPDGVWTVIASIWAALTVLGILVGLGALIARPHWRRTAVVVGIGVLLGAVLIIGALYWFAANYHEGG